MAAGEIKDGEEGLVSLAIAPVGPGAGLVPGVLEIFGLVIGFTVIGAVVTVVFEVTAEGLDMLRQFSGATHMVGANGSLVHASNDSGTTGGAYTGGGKGIGVTHGVGCQLVDKGRYGVFVAKTADVRTDIFAGQP